MSYSSGTFSLYTPGNPVVTGTSVASDWANNTLNDIATGLSTALLKDGSQTVTANIPMSSFKFTGLAAGTAAGNSARYEQVTTALAVTGGTMTGVPITVNSQSAAYPIVATDAGKFLLHPTADNNARTFTLPAEASINFSVGTIITFVNQVNVLSIAITTDTMTLAGAGTVGTRTLAANGIATVLKIASAAWIISGTGLT